MRTSRRQLATMVLGWLGVVAVVASLTFVVIDNAGRVVGQPAALPDVVTRTMSSPATVTPAPTVPVTVPPTTSGTPSPSTTPTAAPGTPSAEPSIPSTTRTPYAVPSTPRDWSRPSTGATPPAWTPSSPAPSTGPSPTTSATSPDRPTHTSTFRTDGGAVTASCTGTVLSLQSIAPLNGWRFRQEHEDGHLEVVFTNGDRRVEVVVVCDGGVPVLSGVEPELARR